jgi:hypothetical protein
MAFYPRLTEVAVTTRLSKMIVVGGFINLQDQKFYVLQEATGGTIYFAMEEQLTVLKWPERQERPEKILPPLAVSKY